MAQMTAQPRAHARFPEPLQARVLAHLVRMAKLNKSYAWWAAKHYAALHPDELGEMPQMLTQAMRANAEVSGLSTRPPGYRADVDGEKQ